MTKEIEQNELTTESLNSTEVDNSVDIKNIEQGELVAENELLENDEQDAIEETVVEEASNEPVIFSGINKNQFDMLTNKNQQFMVTLERQIRGELPAEVEKRVFNEILETLLDGQSESHTAKYIYGTPTELAQVIREQNLEGYKPVIEEERSSDLLIGIDGALFLGSLFTFITGVSMVVTKNPDSKAEYMGIITVFINYFIAGLSMLATSKYMPRPDAPKGKKGYSKYFLVSILSMLMWFFVVSGSNFILPKSINPVLPGVFYMMLGGVTFTLRFVLKKHYKIKGGIF